jgi:hypothetical protein
MYHTNQGNREAATGDSGACCQARFLRTLSTVGRYRTELNVLPPRFGVACEFLFTRQALKILCDGLLKGRFSAD